MKKDIVFFDFEEPTNSDYVENKKALPHLYEYLKEFYFINDVVHYKNNDIDFVELEQIDDCKNKIYIPIDFLNRNSDSEYKVELKYIEYQYNDFFINHIMGSFYKSCDKISMSFDSCSGSVCYFFENKVDYKYSYNDNQGWFHKNGISLYDFSKGVYTVRKWDSL
jgi:hypothetical protein